ncbi:MAG: hypothetical protein RRA45_03985 [Saccharolobus sp.]|jgi:hypothetical protein|uniref:hypothetical protein n=1 Tax=Saccharolobus sp. TaxID=2100761 RepID=UPI0028CCEB6C|nr:hypothetical protein [Saccharolobus sp.]MDT7861356.1 hypothetical protein [Saccharolobus sp.]
MSESEDLRNKRRSDPWRIGSDIKKNLDDICLKINMKKSYKCTDKLIESSMNLILEDINIVDGNIQDSLIGLKYLISSNFFKKLIYNINEKIIDDMAENLLQSLNNANNIGLNIFMIGQENVSECTQSRNRVESIIKAIVYLFNDDVKLRVKGGNLLEILFITKDSNVTRFIQLLIRRILDKYNEKPLNKDCELNVEFS